MQNFKCKRKKNKKNLSWKKKESQERSAFEKEKFGKELEAKMALEQAKLDNHVIKLFRNIWCH